MLLAIKAKRARVQRLLLQPCPDETAHSRVGRPLGKDESAAFAGVIGSAATGAFWTPV